MGLSIHSAVLSGSSSQQQWFLFSFTWRCVFISRRIIVTSSNNGTGTIANRYDSLIHKVIKKLVFIYVANPAMWFANALLIKKHLRRFNTFWRITRSGKKFRNTLSRRCIICIYFRNRNYIIDNRFFRCGNSAEYKSPYHQLYLQK